MKNKFFTFIDPALSYIDKGHFFRQPFRWLYGVIAVLNLLFPLFLLFRSFEFFEYAGAKLIVAFILAWLVLCGVAWFAFQSMPTDSSVGHKVVFRRCNEQRCSSP